jgi:hypothetical protein
MREFHWKALEDPFGPGEYLAEGCVVAVSKTIATNLATQELKKRIGLHVYLVNIEVNEVQSSQVGE